MKNTRIKRTRIESITIKFSRDTEDMVTSLDLTEKDKVSLNNEFCIMLNDRIQQLLLNLLKQTGKEYEVAQIIKFDTNMKKEGNNTVRFVSMDASIYLLLREV